MMKKFLGNTALILVSILLTYGLMEVFFRFAMPYIPMAFFNNECRELRTIGQTSKQETTPISPYIAILGDSYGAGQGDWLPTTDTITTPAIRQHMWCRISPDET